MLDVGEIKMLAQLERQMDAGEVFFVLLDGERVAVSNEVAEELGLERGQTINRTIFAAILRAQIAQIEAQIALDETTS